MRSILEEHGRDRTFCRCVIWVIVLYERTGELIHFARSKKHRTVLLSAVSLYMYLQDVSGYIQLSVRRQEGVWRQFSSEPIRGCSMALQSSRSCHARGLHAILERHACGPGVYLSRMLSRDISKAAQYGPGQHCQNGCILVVLVKCSWCTPRAGHLRP